MKYTHQEYAEKALEANNTGRLLIINSDNKLELIEIVKTEGDIIIGNIPYKENLISEANKI